MKRVSTLKAEVERVRCSGLVDACRATLSFLREAANSETVINKKSRRCQRLTSRTAHLHCREPALHMRPPGIGAYEQPLIVGQLQGQNASDESSNRLSRGCKS
eukprot:4783568-Pleurochrysis_carterae.AAC.4